MTSTFHSKFKVWLLSVPDSKLICLSPIHSVFPLLSTSIHSTPLWYRLYFHTHFHLHCLSSIFTAHPLSTSPPPLPTVTASHVWHRKVRTWIMWQPNYNISEWKYFKDQFCKYSLFSSNPLTQFRKDEHLCAHVQYKLCLLFWIGVEYGPSRRIILIVRL